MSSEVASPGRGDAIAGRTRDVRIDAAVLDAAAELLVEVGYRKLSMSAIAERAGTTKTALYRRWSGKAEVFSALRDRLVVAVERLAVHPDVDADRLVEVLGRSAMLHALMLGDREFDDTWAEQLAAIVLHGVLR